MQNVMKNISGTIFLEFWKRAESRWAFLWDVTDYEVNEPDRPEFYGTATENVRRRKALVFLDVLYAYFCIHSLLQIHVPVSHKKIVAKALFW